MVVGCFCILVNENMESKMYLLFRPVVIKQPCIQVLFPRIVDGIARRLDLISQDRWYFPRRREAQSLLFRHLPDKKVIEKMPLALLLRRPL